MKLADIAEIRPGYPFRGRIESQPGGEVAAVLLRNLDDTHGIDWSDAPRVKLPGRRRPDFLESGNILFPARGNRNLSVCLGEVPGPAVCAPHFFTVRVDTDAVLPAFISWQLNQKPAQRYLEMSAEGTAVRNVRRQTLEQLQLVIPPLERQQKIVALADTVRRERANLEQRINNGRQLLDAIAFDLINSQQ